MSFFNISKRFLLILIVLSFIFPLYTSNITAKESNNLDGVKFDCESIILMDATTGEILYESNADKALPPASVTKIMTLLLVMEEVEKGNLKFTDTITASAYASSMGGSQIFLKEGESMSAEDMIKSVVIASANDAAVALAEHIAGSEEIFVQRMNERAKELGMKNTNFENTNGLDDTARNHVTSARDIAIMSRELLRHEEIIEYSSTWMDTIRGGAFGLTNTNRLVRFFKGATGLKTGYTSKSGFCVSATAKRGEMHLICVIMGASNSNTRNTIATDLLNWGFSNYDIYKNPSEKLKAIRVKGGVEDLCPIESEDFSKIIKKGEGSKIQKNYVLPEFISAPVKIGDEIGYVEYFSNGELIGKSPIISKLKIEKIEFWGLFDKILSVFLIK